MLLDVVYDLNSLGQVIFWGRKITGVNRVVRDLAAGILHRQSEYPDVNLQLSSLNYPQSVDMLQRYYLCNGFDVVFAGLSEKERLIYRMFGVERWKGKLLSTLVDPFRRTDSAVDIFHSPFYTYPKRFSASSTIKIQSVYDIFPLTDPKFFSSGKAKKDASMLRKIPVSADYFVSSSEYTKGQVCDFFSLDESRVYVVPAAASSDLFYPVTDDRELSNVRSRYGIGDNDYLFSLATLEPRKNIVSLIEAFFQVLENAKSPGLKLVLAGRSGWGDLSYFSGLGQYSRFFDQVCFVGHVDDSLLAPLLSGAVSFVFPSFKEGFGLPPLEAMQCGTPVITSNISSLPEVVGDAAYLVDPYSVDSISNGIVNVLGDSRLRAKMTAAGLRRSSEFSWELSADQMVGVYRQCHDLGKY